MAKKNKGKRAKGKRGEAANGPPSGSGTFWTPEDECAYHAALGCHIANIARCRAAQSTSTRPKGAATSSPPITCSEYEELYDRAMQQYPWLLGMEQFHASEYHPEDRQHIPQIAINDGDDEDERMTLTLTNVSKDTTNICYVTVFDVDLCDGQGNILQSGVSSTTTSIKKSGEENGEGTTTTTRERKCTTFIVLCPPQTFVHLCCLAPNQSITSWTRVEIESDVQQWSFHPNPNDEHPQLLHFPFVGIGEDALPHNEEAAKSYQCTQSEAGQLTHFFEGNLHAIDFACPAGTPLYAPSDGVVVSVRDRVNPGEDCNTDSNFSEVSGIAASNLFHWNSIMMRAEGKELQNNDPLYVEMVHIQTNSCVVRVGDRVRKGQLLCRSGSVGFSPEAHLHLAAYRSCEDDAATVRVRFEGVADSSTGDSSDSTSNAFLPVSGGWYSRHGLVK